MNHFDFIVATAEKWAELNGILLSFPRAIQVPQEDQRPEQIRTRERPGWTALAFIAACVLAVIALYLAGARRIRPPSPPSSIAVLPFLNLAGDPAIERLSDDLTRQITDEMAKVGWLRVADRAAALEFKGRTVKVQDAGRRLGVDLLIQGAVSQSPGRLHVMAQLVSTARPYQLWSHTYDIDAQSAAAFETEASRAIATAVQAEIKAGGSSSARK